ncbi:phenylacetate-CoA ligase [Rubrobacter xylanophilus DSM 9941]|uniref:Phenylacetate-CoA ligase n=1 Tax=Rubrobacter xylanophilus (strain DSM 9941 / JCM 11954 / NBRC 16129 / PRD-1) TaxID=266117 RepID=Q1AUX8_RUBXD|nr:AMP-binding protein [Rubrobacter xylanophilus]ABG04800.1 phenylacetate-CoA ligase [Rubrobacter xylanophilus DSM 9941]
MPGKYRRHFDPEWETSDPEFLRPKLEERLRAQLVYTYENSPLYRRKFDEAGVDPSGIGLDDLGRLPFTVKDEVRRTQEKTPPLGEHACVGWEEISRIHASSGTTGKPTLVGATICDRQMWNELVARSLWAQGVRPDSRAWVALSLGWWIAGLQFLEGLQYLGASVLPGGNTEPARSFSVVQETGLDFVISTPSFVQYLAGFARENHIDLKSLGVKNMGLGGEPGAGNPHTRRQIEDTWGCKVYDCMGTADVCTVVWSECEEQDGMHFMGQGFVLPEIIDPSTGSPIEPVKGATGELVYTAIWRECTPLIRYRMNDIIEVVGDAPCSCGRTSYRIRCLGRADDMLIVRGVNVYPSAVADVVRFFRPRVTGHIQIQADGPGPSVEPPVRIRVEYGEEKDLNRLKKEIEGRIRRELIFASDVELVEPGTLAPKGNMKTKLVVR